MRTTARIAVIITTAAALGTALPASAATTTTTDDRTDLMAREVHRALDGEAFAYASYQAFAGNAGKDTAAARTWRTVADVEYWDHFVTVAGAGKLVGTNTQNLQKAVDDEATAAKTYRAAAAVARADGCSAVADSLEEISADEQVHHDLFVKALDNLRHGRPAPAAPAVRPEKIVPSKPACTTLRTLKAVYAAAHTESLAWGTYTQYAKKAANTGRPQLAALFTGIGSAELDEHFAKEANMLGMVGSVRRNLLASTAAEVAADLRYTADIKKAGQLNCPQVVALLKQLRADERGHVRSFLRLLER